MKKLLNILFGTAIAIFNPLASAQVARPDFASQSTLETFPYSMTGQLIFRSGTEDYQGTGTTIYKRSVLTAAHNCWDIQNGWSTFIEFNRARAGDANPVRQVLARRVYVFAGYQTTVRKYHNAIRDGAETVQAFASDLGGLRFPTALANGAYAGWSANYNLLRGTPYNIALGYGNSKFELGETPEHDGNDLLFVEPDFGFLQVYKAFFESEQLVFEEGMSGGPVFAEVAPGVLRIAAIIVAGSDLPDPPSGGIRALDAAAARFLQTYLRY